MKREEKEKYITPELEFFHIKSRDVLCASGGSMDVDPYHYGDGGGV